jgi:hypothetical protein
MDRGLPEAEQSSGLTDGQQPHSRPERPPLSFSHFGSPRDMFHQLGAAIRRSIRPSPSCRSP